MKILIYGAGKIGNEFAERLKRCPDNEFIGFIDRDESKSGGCVYHTSALRSFPGERFDKIYIAIHSATACLEAYEFIRSCGIDSEKIAIANRTNSNHPRVSWLGQFAKYSRDCGICGNVAEVGVRLGDYAEHINDLFYDKKLYLFDTFNGFDEADVDFEETFNREGLWKWYVKDPRSAFKDTSARLVLLRMPFKEKVEIREGYFPDTARDINDTFCFVNLDVDIFKPTLEGLRFFYDKMETGGVILIHDFFDEALCGVKKAVEEFERERGIRLAKAPCGDRSSLIVIKY